MLQSLSSIAIFDNAALATAAAIAFAGALSLAYHNWRLRRSLGVSRDYLKQAKENYRSLIECSPQITWVLNADGHLIEISPRWAEIIGEQVEGAFGDSWTEYAHPDDLPRTVDAWNAARARADDGGINTRCRLRCADGNYRWFRARGRPHRDEQGRVKWYGTIEDINDQVSAELALRASEERYRLASRATNDVIWDWAVEKNRIEWSEAVESALGYPEAICGTSLDWWVERLHPDDKLGTLAQLERVLAGDVEHWAQEYRFRSQPGEYLDVLSRGYVVRDAEGKPLRMIGAMLDMTARKRSEDELRWAATHDPLTQLPNRKLFELRLVEALEKAAQVGGCVGLTVLDVDGFKMLNDTHGHLAGDALLRELAGRLVRHVPSDATVARLGGDELAVILPTLPPPGRTARTIGRVHGRNEPAATV